MKKCKLQLAYVGLLSLCVPLNVFYVTLCEKLLVFMDDSDSAELLLWIYAVLGIGYWIAIAVLGIMNIAKAFKTFRQGDVSACINGMPLTCL